MENVKLYTTEACPYCVVVKDFIEKNNLDMTLKAKEIF